MLISTFVSIVDDPKNIEWDKCDNSAIKENYEHTST